MSQDSYMNSSEGMRRLGENLRSRRIILACLRSLSLNVLMYRVLRSCAWKQVRGGKIEHLMKIASVLGIAEDLISAVDPP